MLNLVPSETQRERGLFLSPSIAKPTDSLFLVLPAVLLHSPSCTLLKRQRKGNSFLLPFLRPGSRRVFGVLGFVRLRSGFWVLGGWCFWPKLLLRTS